jgi:glucose-like phosphotransferase system IIB component
MIMNNVTGDFSEFVAISKVQKTLRNELRPTPLTMKHIKQKGIITEDEYKTQQSLELKRIADGYYRDYITHKLNDTNNLDFRNLFEAIEEKYKKNDKDNRDKLDLVEKSKRGEIAKLLSADDNFKSMFEAKLITQLLPVYVEQNYIGEDKEKALETIALFKGFTTYFTDYFNIRKNMFKENGGASSICYRIVNVNASIFYDNLKTFMCIKEKAETEIALIEEELTELLDSWRLEHIFSEDYYNELLAQKGIDYYNQICGDVNKHMNLYCQQNKLKANVFKMTKLQKQIMGISEKAFEIPPMYQNDEEVYAAFNGFISRLEEVKLTDRLGNVLQNSNIYDTAKIYINARCYTNVSSYVYGGWGVIESAIERYWYNTIAGKGQSKAKKIEKAKKDNKFMSVKELDSIVSDYEPDYFNASNMDDDNSGRAFSGYGVLGYFNKMSKLLANMSLHTITYDSGDSLIENKETALNIKKDLDDIMSIYHWLQTFIIDEVVEKDNAFYAELEDIYYELENIVTLYDRIRNYVTRKPYSTQKFKLNFASPTLASGWSRSKEFDNNAIILLRNNKYYIAIFNVNNKPDKQIIKGSEEQRLSTDYKKMVYNLLPGPNKMLPKVFIKSDTGKRDYNPSSYILEGYEKNRHIKSSGNFDINYCHDLIDYYKACINKHPEWKNYGFKFKETTQYNDIGQFYKDVEKQGYSISWAYISEADINRLDEEGKIYLFEIYNKDLSSHSTGKDNLHTMYLKNIFSEDNLKNICIELNGNAELFYRKSSMKRNITHKKDTVLVNKTYINEAGVRVSLTDEDYIKVYNYYNNDYVIDVEKDKKLVEILERIGHRKNPIDIIKDKRYTEDKYFLHLPITINYGVDDENINDKMIEYIAKHNNMNVIGGIIAGVFGVILHNKFRQVELHPSLTFYSGKRFVPIITALIMPFIGMVLVFIWPVINNIIMKFGSIIANLNILGVFLYGFLEKAINPTGLHHILNQAFRFTALGGMETVAGQTQVGALNIYFAQLENHLPFSTHATQYLAQGKILHMVFGMPAAVFTIYKCALPQYREKVIRYFLPGVTAVILTGITEPIEFTYIFISPALWLINSVLAGLAFMIPAMFGAAIGNIQGGIIDWFVFGTLQGTSTKWYIYLFLGPMFAVTYYFIYSFIINKFNVMTIGKSASDFEEVEEKSENTTSSQTNSQENSLGADIVAGLGGIDNIVDVDNCISRLRVEIKDKSKVNQELIKKSKPNGIIIPDDHNVHIVYGGRVTKMRNLVDDYLFSKK